MVRTGDLSVYVPQRRPHIRQSGRQLFFMISRRPLLELSAEEALVYDCIDGRKTVADLDAIHPGARDWLLKWHKAAAIELIRPITPPVRPHLVVVEPHMDDAVLSTGGRLLHRRGRNRITIVSVIRWSNFTSYVFLKRDFLNVHDVTLLREQESALAARFLGAEHRCLNWTDAPLRFYPAESWTPAVAGKFAAAPLLTVDLIPNAKEVSRIAAGLSETLAALEPDELWIPMAPTNNVDHRTTRSACLLVLNEARGRFADLPVAMYEDLPHGAMDNDATQIRAALTACGTRLVRRTEDVTDVFDEKLRLVSVYASQFKLSHMEPELRAAAAREGQAPGRLAEAYHDVAGLVRLPRESHLSRDWNGLETLRRELRPLLANRIRCGRLTMAALPTGSLARWKTESELLASVFPEAQIRVYAAENIAWQAGPLSGRFSLRVVRGNWPRWIGAIARELLHFRTPTLVLRWGAYGSRFKRILIRSVLPFRRVLFAKTLADFCWTIAEQLSPDVPTMAGTSAHSPEQ